MQTAWVAKLTINLLFAVNYESWTTDPRRVCRTKHGIEFYVRIKIKLTAQFTWKKFLGPRVRKFQKVCIKLLRKKRSTPSLHFSRCGEHERIVATFCCGDGRLQIWLYVIIFFCQRVRSNDLFEEMQMHETQTPNWRHCIDALTKKNQRDHTPDYILFNTLI